MVTKRKASKRSRSRPSPEELEKRNHRKEIRTVFRNAGFNKIDSVSDKEITFGGRTGDFDDVFVYQNILVLVEYTTAKSSNISTHLLKKKILWDHILSNKSDFIEYFESRFPSFAEARDSFFTPDQCKLIVVYCSKQSIGRSHKEQVPGVVYLDYPIVKYFVRLTNAIRLSSRFELFAFLGLSYSDIGLASTQTSESYTNLDGTLLPENHSNFPKGYKIVSFYVDPESLLQMSYVLRKDGWKDDIGLYQRMISNPKIRAIRRYLDSEERVFVNNIIVTLPHDTKLLDGDGDTIDPSSLHKTTPITIQIPNGFNSIGLIDGQHRIFAYHEGGEFEEKIRKLRLKQNLLATGIVYPKKMAGREKTRFESGLFLEINSTQTGATSELKQAIGLLLRPFSSESIAKAVVNRLNLNGPMENQFEVYFYDKDRIKTASIVSYGLKPIVKLSGADSFYSLWSDVNKSSLLGRKDEALLNDYIDFCVTHINEYLTAVKRRVSDSNWTTDKASKNRVLTTTAINGLVICLRKLVEEGKTGSSAYYYRRFDGLDGFRFGGYKSSQYGAMARALVDRFFP